MIHVFHPRLPECLAVWSAILLWVIHNRRRRRSAPPKIATATSLLPAVRRGPRGYERQVLLSLSPAHFRMLHQLMLDRGLDLEDEKGDGNPQSSLLFDVARQINNGLLKAS